MSEKPIMENTTYCPITSYLSKTIINYDQHSNTYYDNYFRLLQDNKKNVKTRNIKNKQIIDIYLPSANEI